MSNLGLSIHGLSNFVKATYRHTHLHCSSPPTNMFLAPPQRKFTAAELVKGGKFRGRSNADSMDARAKEISSIVYAQVLEVLRLYAPDTIHVFTHAGNDMPRESSRGLFHNSNYYFSALRRHRTSRTQAPQTSKSQCAALAYASTHSSE